MSGRTTMSYQDATTHRYLRCALAALTLCAATACQSRERTEGTTGSATAGPVSTDSARTAFLAEVDRLLLDTQIHELRGQLGIKLRNTNPNDPESPLVDQDLPHPPGVGPHTYLGVMHAEVEALRSALGDSARQQGTPLVAMSIEGDRVFLGRAPDEQVILGHRHGDQLFVPVKLFARPYGAYVRVACPLANCASIWPRDILLYMRRTGYTSSAGVLEGYVEGLLDSVDVRKLPTG